MIVLGIESSCDETAVALVDDKKHIISHIIFSQFDAHRLYGGVVPEIAARNHLDHLDRLLKQLFKESQLTFDEIDGIAATSGPGLIGGVIVGLMTAKTLALVHDKPFIAINHLEGHALTPRLSHDVSFPYLLLLVSGGHTQLIIVEDVGKYTKLGTTLDDAVGEAFDKTAKILDIGYPGGPLIEQHAAKGNPKRFALPRPLKGKDSCDFSLSGLKTAVKYLYDREKDNFITDDVNDLCASFQQAISDVLTDRCKRAFKQFKQRYPQGKHFVIAGGVASNSFIRDNLRNLSEENNLFFIAPPKELCTDNGAMIAWAGIERLQRGLTNSLNTKPRPRWPLEELTNIGNINA
jgi:tRNA N6-adenosine threonylcarbamoyltransferase